MNLILVEICLSVCRLGLCQVWGGFVEGNPGFGMALFFGSERAPGDDEGYGRGVGGLSVGMSVSMPSLVGF